jgi:hypothetical protein
MRLMRRIEKLAARMPPPAPVVWDERYSEDDSLVALLVDGRRATLDGREVDLDTPTGRRLDRWAEERSRRRDGDVSLVIQRALERLTDDELERLDSIWRERASVDELSRRGAP